MINELKSGTSTLRFENSRRHKIRNLRAKVRSLLPEQVCAREMKRRQKNNRSQSGQHTGKVKRYQSSDFDKKMNKEFDKLTKEEIEEINSNKYYFLGSEEGIFFYERYLNDNHPQFIQKKFVPPVVSSENVSPFGFVPMTLLNSRKKQGSKSFVTIKEIPEKRESTASTNIRKRSIAMTPLDSGRRSPLTKMQKIERCKHNKNEHDEEIRIKREIGYAHLQRQQKQASASRLIQVQGKAEQARMWNTSSTFAKHESQSSKNIVQKYEIALLASKLRKVCLKKSYNKSVTQGDFLKQGQQKDKLYQMSGEAYKEKVNLKKEKQAEQVWSKIAKEPKLAGLLDLHNKIKDLQKRRDRNRDYMEDVDSNYKALKKNIKDFSKVQNTDKKKR